MRSQFVNSNVLPSPRRRSHRIRQFIAVAVALVMLAGAVSLVLSAWPKGTSAYEPQLREFTLTASEFDWEIQPGTVVKAWGYNQQMPGPEIRVKEGDRVRVTL